MATIDINSKRPVVVSTAKFLDKLKLRVIDSSAQPRHLVVGIHFGDVTTFHFHTAGKEAIWELSVFQAGKNDRLVKGLLPEDALQLGFYYGKQIHKGLIKELLVENQLLNSKLNLSTSPRGISNATT